MEKHARDKREVIIDWEPRPKGPSRVGVPGRHEAVLVEEMRERMLGHGKLKQEDQAIGQNDEPRRNRWVPRWNRVSYRESCFAAGCPFISESTTPREQPSVRATNQSRCVPPAL
jgi:hypothetical protein